jgi:HEAT repeat protein
VTFLFLKRWHHQKKSDLQALGVSLIALRKEDPDQVPLLQKLIDSSPVQVRAALAEKLSSRSKGGNKLIARLSEDKSATVRAYIASAEPSKERFNVIMKLTGDSDFEVRRTAAVSLGNYKSPESVNKLIDLISDESYEVRTAAENSIVKIRPGNDLIKRIGDESLQSEISRPSAIKILGELKDVRFAPEINKILGVTEDRNLILLSIKALDKLNFKQSAKNMKKHSEKKDLEIREAIAHALGTFGLRESFDTIIYLSRLQEKMVFIQPE